MPRKLNQADVEARIHALHAAGGVSQRDIAAQLRISTGFVNKTLKKNAPTVAAPQAPHPAAPTAPKGEPFALSERAPTGAKKNKEEHAEAPKEAPAPAVHDAKQVAQKPAAGNTLREWVL